MQKAIRITDTSLESFNLLSNAIIIQAAKDYRDALRKQKRNPESVSAFIRIEEVEQFFRSDWYRLLTTIEGETLIRDLRNEVAT